VKTNLQPSNLNFYIVFIFLLVLVSLGATILVASKISQIYFLNHYLSSLGDFIVSLTGIINIIIKLDIESLDIAIASVFFFLLILIFSVLFIKSRVRKNKRVDYRHASGPELLEFRQAVTNVNKKLRNEPDNPALFIHPNIRITSQIEEGNIFIFGQQGSGKSTVIKLIAKQIYSSRHLSFTNDEKGEYKMECGTANTLSISLEHNADFFWEISKDILNSNDANLVSQALIEESQNGDQFFVDAARQILAAVIVYLQGNTKKWSWEDLNNTLFITDGKLKSILQINSPSAAILIEPESKMTHSIRAVLSSRLGWINQMVELKKSALNDWSINEFINSKDTIKHIFFKPNQKHPEMRKSVCNALMTLLIERWLCREDSNEEHLWIILDELGNIPKNPSIERWLTLSRSKGGKTLAGTQSISQLYKYGQHSTETILSLFRTVIVMRLGSAGPSAQKASDLLGQQRVISLNKSLNDRENLTLSTQFHDRPVVTKEEIVNLPSADKNGVVGYLFIGGLVNVYKLKWPFTKRSSYKKAIITASPGKPELLPIVKSQPINRLNKRKKQSNKINKEYIS
jgi:energy-coupling factor transporter ATP-binding protein EcfA2